MGMGSALEAAVELGPVVVAEKELMESDMSSGMGVTKSEAVHWN
jgi:hypothetical protein